MAQMELANNYSNMQLYDTLMKVDQIKRNGNVSLVYTDAVMISLITGSTSKILTKYPAGYASEVWDIFYGFKPCNIMSYWTAL